MELITKGLPNLSSFEKILAGSEFGGEFIMDFNDYKKFLFLIAKFPHCSAVPTKKIDEIWHRHLQNDSLYTQDCLNYFGRKITHNECKNVTDIPKIQEKFILTKKNWVATFSSPYGEICDMAFCGFDGDDGGNDQGPVK